MNHASYSTNANSLFHRTIWRSYPTLPRVVLHSFSRQIPDELLVHRFFLFALLLFLTAVKEKYIRTDFIFKPLLLLHLNEYSFNRCVMIHE